MARTGWNTNQLLNIVNRPLGPERTLGALIAFTSSKNYMEVVRMLNREDAAKLVDVFDQVCLASFCGIFTCLTTVVITRLSGPSTRGEPKI